MRNRWMSRQRSFALLVGAILLFSGVVLMGGGSASGSGPLGTVTEYPTPTANSFPTEIIAGPDGNMWFTEQLGNAIGKITTGGSVTEYPLPNPNSHPLSIVAGPDGNLWFTEGIGNGNRIGKITTSGTITEYPVPTANSAPDDITVGPDGNIWFTEALGNKIGKITTSGTITEYPVPTAGGLAAGSGICAGPDGNMWFTEGTANKVGKISTDGSSITEYTVPTANSVPDKIEPGPDGNLWFTEYAANKVAKVTTSGAFTEYTVPTTNSGPNDLRAGPDGNIWFTEYNANKVGKVTTSGAFAEYATPTTPSGPSGIAPGPDGNMWFTETSGSKIGTIGTGIPDPPTAVSGIAGNGQVSVSWVAPVNNGGAPITSYTVTSSGGQQCTWTSGPLTCTVSGLTNGTSYTFTVVATNTNGNSLPSAPSGPVIPGLIFPSSGNFVIGDQHAAVGNSITFWGAQWAKQNTLSGSPSPSSFKGFAAAPSGMPNCASGWSSGPGNSAGPPATVPGVMAVLVSSAASKTGPGVSGTVTELAIVQTNPGYGPDPGHTGTGTIVALVPCPS